MATKLLYVWKRRVNQLKMETYTIYLAYKDPRVPWYAKILIVCVIGYAFSPIDKPLEAIPILGYLDHLVLVPLGLPWHSKCVTPMKEIERRLKEILEEISVIWGQEKKNEKKII